MPTYVYIGRDSARGVELRKVHREAHLARLDELEVAGRIRYGGPLRDADSQPCGSVVIFEADDLDAARAWAEADPYLAEGIFESLEVFETAAIFPKNRAG
ncbi:MAG: hypothetical protein JRG96_11615 [Deltaproteobacteria bacterium]|nr:hypothetical protein [Deltaproteobacteria bacterium]MBW2420817.1 hypothetical protein [Deltaproteobacteria bacterium]